MRVGREQNWVRGRYDRVPSWEGRTMQCGSDSQGHINIRAGVLIFLLILISSSTKYRTSAGCRTNLGWESRL